jgi:cytochrome c peroxidase
MKLLAFLFTLTLSLGAWANVVTPLPEKPPEPKNNKITAEKAELGKVLYFDPRLSKNGTISCNTCHNVMAGGVDGRAVSVGIDGQKGGRSAPSVFNAAFISTQFWDGRAKSLEEQAIGPMTNPIEMGMDNHKIVIKRIKDIPGYKALFKKAFGSKKINLDRVAKAIATYERTLVTPNSPFDKFLAGDKKAISKKAQRGWKTAQEVGCLTCHSGSNFSGPWLGEGNGFFMKFPMFPSPKLDKKYEITKDLGRYEVTKKDSDKNFWRVPTWRNIAITAPYFHNGAVATLDEAVRVMAKTQLNKDLSRKQVRDIVAFLETLTGEIPPQTMPTLPPTNGRIIVDGN